MKCLYFLIFLSSVSLISPYQDDHRFVFTEVVATRDVPLDILRKNGIHWLIKNKFQEIDTLDSNNIKAENSFFVYQKGLITKQIHGRVHYKFLLEIKDEKYRFTFSDFVFHYYRQDRNLNMFPTGKEKPLSDITAKGWQKTWEQHKVATEKQIQFLILSLKKSMPLIPHPAKGSSAADF